MSAGGVTWTFTEDLAFKLLEDPQPPFARGLNNKKLSFNVQVEVTGNRTRRRLRGAPRFRLSGALQYALWLFHGLTALTMGRVDTHPVEGAHVRK